MTSRKYSIGNNHNLNCKDYLKYLLVLAVLVGFSSPLYSQSKKQLEKDKARVEQEIKNLNSQLGKAKKNSKNNQKQLQLLEEKIAQRTRLINNLDGQLNLLGVQITQTQDSIALVRSQVDSLKAEYAKVVRTLYGERGNLDKLVLLLDTKSYNYAYLRTRWFRDYSRYRRRQAAHIRQKEEELTDVQLELAKQQREQTTLLVQQKRQKDQLAQEQKQKQKSLKDSKQQEKNLQAQISKKEKQKRQLQQQIQNIINEEIAKANRAKKAASGSSASGPAPKSAEEVALTSDFAGNKGRLPWPVTYTKVAREYGRYTHSSGGQNMNNGIDLVCRPGTSVQAVFGGTVSRVFTTPGGTRGIIIRHGDYMTVYANMGSVAVKEGTKVSTRQNIGTVYTNEDGTAEFSFQLWKGTSSQNPRTWLR
ncbi:MAG: peptidoglycan DD-metalloendopeptidase family protein [Bacteroidales bacterium]|nr:peptidoglycan DD-metalloendopeptidase family protein [Bacteroidales bacterium]